MDAIRAPKSASASTATKDETKSDASIDDTIKKYRPDLEPYEKLYKEFHSHPELSTLEFETAAKAVKQLKSISPTLDVRTSIGGNGLVSIFENGPGKTVLLRTDLDGLPVEEKTGLDYASTDTMKDTDGLMKSTMHACGHDMHITSLLAATEMLISAKDAWSGTLISCFQPAEEKGSGARAMVDDGLYESSKHNVPKPDFVLGQHIMPERAGRLSCRHGEIMCAANSFKITIHGRGGHGSMPHNTIDPIPIAASVVLKLQTIVSREVPPSETAVVTVGSLQAGHTENIISDSAVLRVNVRTKSEGWRDKIIASIKRIVKGECDAGNCEKEPEIEQTTWFPLTVNDDSLATTIDNCFASYFGHKYNGDAPLVFASEDFSILGSSIGKPTCFWFVGCTPAEHWDAAEKKGRIGEEVPVNHSPYFAPAIQPTLTTCVDAMGVAALTFLGKE